ncbi:thioester domain-containing protein [Saccharothrix sp. S26]|uniref:thioester domain-containing protein n=1 Tax=Saccharothrix sp. S26 TaxID=2907215 RepID=UPI001F1DF02B|nr:thioester domain-containing protein [Saccharothrix sp. S26]MCE6996870.1 thioester domain-containing protein [Saccharothrix sp. S26]
MASRSTVKRLGAAILGAGLVLMSALPAAAADKPKVEPYDGANEPGMGIYLERDGQVLDNDKKKEGIQGFNASLIGLRLQAGDESQTAKAYCVELPTPLEDGKPLVEVPWGEHPNPDTKFKQNAAKVNWVLQNSYPALSVEDAYELYGLNPKNKRSILIAATQAAVWHFSDGVDLREENSTEEEEDVYDGTVDDLVYKVYEYLTTKAQDLAEPKPTLSIEPGELTGKAGGKIGPFVVSTTATEAILTAELPAGVTIVDADGKPLPVVDPDARAAAASATNVAEVWVKVDSGVEPGEVEFTVTASAKLRSGRLFVSSDRNDKTQSLVIAKSEVFPVKAAAKAKWTEGTVVTTTTEATTTTSPTTTTTTAPTTTTTTVAAGAGGDDDLANTGASIFVPLLIGVGLLGAGAGALLFLRRKRAA